MYSDQRGTPIYRSTLEYQIKTRKRIHGTTCKITQFPLRLAWAVTGHKVQGLTIKRGSDVVAHGYIKGMDLITTRINEKAALLSDNLSY